MSRLRAVVSDFGGVLTSPLLASFLAFQESTGIPPESLGTAMAAIAARGASNPLFELETGRATEAQFLSALGEELTDQLGRPVKIDDFGTKFMGNLHPNEPMIEYMRQLRHRGYRMAICTNNVREWEPLWRAKVPVDEIFELVIDSGFVGVRKPDPEIYAMVLSGLNVEATATIFVDDIKMNCDAAEAAGMVAVHFRDTDQAITELEAALA